MSAAKNSPTRVPSDRVTTVRVAPRSPIRWASAAASSLGRTVETANRITVLRLGRNVGVYERDKTTQEEVVHAITAGQPTKVAGIPGTGNGASA